MQSMLDDGTLRVAPQVWAEALHDPTYRSIVSGLFTGPRGRRWPSACATPDGCPKTPTPRPWARR
jgi:hypothetical protein